MRSLQVINVEGKDYSGYSDLQVLKSTAGWYIGTIYTDPDTNFQEPGSRDSDYFATEEIAKETLAALEKFHEEDKSDDGLFIFQWENWLTQKGYDPQRVGYRAFP